MAQMIKNPPVTWETWAQSMGWEDLLEKGTLPTPVFWLEISMDRGAWQATVYGVAKRVRHDLATKQQICHHSGSLQLVGKNESII